MTGSWVGDEGLVRDEETGKGGRVGGVCGWMDGWVGIVPALACCCAVAGRISCREVILIPSHPHPSPHLTFHPSPFPPFSFPFPPLPSPSLPLPQYKPQDPKNKKGTHTKHPHRPNNTLVLPRRQRIVCIPQRATDGVAG